MEISKAFQDLYSDENAYCFGCGRLNERGFKLKSYWDGEETVAHFTPKPYHTGGYPGNVYGGLIAAVLDCHGNGTAAGYAGRIESKKDNPDYDIRYVTGSLNITYLKPTPIGKTLELRGKVIEFTERKAVMNLSVLVDGTETVKANMTAIRIKKG